jgi:hypothetical protein
MAYNPNNPNGQATMANSEPVVIASNQTAIPITDNSGSITVDGTVAISGSVAVTGTFWQATQPVSGTITETNSASALTALQLIDDAIYTDDTSTHATGTSKGMGIMCVATPTDTAVSANDIGMVAMTLNRGLHVSVQDALPTGGNTIGRVEVNSIGASTNLIGDVGIKPRTTGGLTTYHLIGAASTNATVVKNSAGQLFGWYLYNGGAAALKVAFHNASSAPTAGASVFFTIMVPPGAAANAFTEIGIAFSTGISITTVTGIADSNNTAIAASELMINLFYS